MLITIKNKEYDVHGKQSIGLCGDKINILTKDWQVHTIYFSKDKEAEAEYKLLLRQIKEQENDSKQI